MVRRSDSEWDWLAEVVSTGEHEDLGPVLEMIMSLDQLRSRGLSVDDIAAEMAAQSVELPGGGTWDGQTVTKILGVVDSVRHERPQQPDQGLLTGPGHRGVERVDDGANPEEFGLHEKQALAERGILLHPLSLTAFGAILLVLGLAAFFTANNTEDVTPSAEGPGHNQAADASTDAPNAPAEDANSGNATTEAPAAIGSPTDGAFVEAKLDLDGPPGPGLFRLTGRVPNAEIEQALIQTVEGVYAPFGQIDLEVDESLDPAPFLATSPQLIALLPSLTAGTMSITETGITLTGRAPDQARIDLLTAGMEQLSGQPVSVGDMELTGLRPYEFNASAEDGRLTIGGEVASELIRQFLIDGATQAYGEGNVVDEFTVSDEVETTFSTYRIPLILALTTNFPRYEVALINESISGTFQGGASFPVDSTEISPEIADLLDLAAGIMASDPSLSMTVTGHTDSTGPDEYNQLLSQQRAESVVAYFTAAGVETARLTAVGAGEAEPIAPNTTPEGRAVNRRITFQVGSSVR